MRGRGSRCSPYAVQAASGHLGTFPRPSVSSRCSFCRQLSVRARPRRARTSPCAAFPYGHGISCRPRVRHSGPDTWFRPGPAGSRAPARRPGTRAVRSPCGMNPFIACRRFAPRPRRAILFPCGAVPAGTRRAPPAGPAEQSGRKPRSGTRESGRPEPKPLPARRARAIFRSSASPGSCPEGRSSGPGPGPDASSGAPPPQRGPFQ